MSANFADRLLEAIAARRNPSVIGLDSDFELIPPDLKEKHAPRPGAGTSALAAAAKCVQEFNQGILEAVADLAPAIKLQIAFYEQLGPAGLEAFAAAVRRARELGLLVIADAKRNDIGNSSRGYARAFLGRIECYGGKQAVFDVDALTVNPYLGSDGVAPFLEEASTWGKGIFVLVKTSNPGSGELQDLPSEGRRIYERMAELVAHWGRGLIGERGFSAVGAVVGATFPREAAALRKLLPDAFFLVPGYGSQGGGADDTVPCFRSDGLGALVHSARQVIFAYRNSPAQNYVAAARAAALAMRAELEASLKKAGRWPW